MNLWVLGESPLNVETQWKWTLPFKSRPAVCNAIKIPGVTPTLWATAVNRSYALMT